MWELDVCSKGELYMGMIHQPKKEIKKQFKIFVVVLTNPQRRTSLHMLQIRKKTPNSKSSIFGVEDIEEGFKGK
jgi:hypothetical protein